MSDVVLTHVCKIYDRDAPPAVDDFNLTIHDGEFLVLVGPSGCGKSTTLRMIAGLEEVTAGAIAIDGKNVERLPPKDRDIAMVFQNYALYPHMTVFENMAFGLRLRGTSKAEIRTRVDEAADILGLRDFLKRLPKQLSGGQRQRVAVGRAIVRKPKVFLFDEPLSNLDAKMRVEMRGEITRLHHRLGATMIYVTHDQTEAMTMGDRIVVMNAGTIQQAAPPLEVYRDPANRFVAGFIGTPPMNIIPCPESTTYLMGIRPEHLGADTPMPGSIIFPATVDIVEPMGAETFLQCILRDGSRVIARVSADTTLRHDAAVTLSTAPAHLLYFDAATGARMTPPRQKDDTSCCTA